MLIYVLYALLPSYIMPRVHMFSAISFIVDIRSKVIGVIEDLEVHQLLVLHPLSQPRSAGNSWISAMTQSY